MKQKISDTSPSISDGGRLKDYWASRIVNPKYSQPDDKYKDVDMTGMLTRYNLKGFEFGRWMTNNDRYDSLHAFDRAIKTLEAVVGSKILALTCWSALHLELAAGEVVLLRIMSLVII